MANLLLKYMEERLKGDVIPSAPRKAGPLPVVTISREAGCSGTQIANKLIVRLNVRAAERNEKVEWKVVNKEVIEMAAKELEMHPSMLKTTFKVDKRNLLDEMILSMSRKYYKSDRQIRKTITDVIRYYAQQGHVVIVGRAGVVITNDHPKAVHIKLHAPVEWRAEVIRTKHAISAEDALKYVRETDKGREKLLRDFHCDPMDCELFDAVLNCKTLTVDDLVDVIIKLMERKNLI